MACDCDEPVVLRINVYGYGTAVIDIRRNSGGYVITSDIPGLFLAGDCLYDLLGDLNIAVSLTKELNAKEQNFGASGTRPGGVGE